MVAVDAHFGYYQDHSVLSPAHELVAEILHPDKVIRRDGGHGWGVWKSLWNEVLKKRFDHDPPFQVARD
ncbi:MAG: hypothetical protein HYS34_11530 [Acidobacteria bacterium]|nr:hypothetical protein [Acidobacteriota bacterium]